MNYATGAAINLAELFINITKKKLKSKGKKVTLAVKVFKECLISTSTNFIGKNTLVLIGIAVVLGVITLGVEIIKMKKEKNNAKDAKNA